MASKTEKSFLVIIFVCAATILALTGIINWVVDPYGLFRIFEIEGLNTQKPSISVNSSWAKSHAVTKVKPKAIILGSSRVEVGISPTSSFWPGDFKPRYNLGLASGNMIYAEKYFQHANSIQPLKQVIIGLDMLMFRADYIRRQDLSEIELFSSSAQNTIFNNISNGIYSLFSLDSFRASIKTVQAQSEISDYKYNYNGMRSIKSFQLKLNKTGQRDLFKASERRFVSARYYNLRRHKQFIYNKPGNTSNELKAFRSLVKTCINNNIDLYAFISPVHARQLELIRLEGQWQAFEDWKYELVKIMNDETRLNRPKTKITLWDFSGYTPITTEAIPKDKNISMKWYWESSHYKQALGDLVLSKIFAVDKILNSRHSEFGVILNTKNIQPHLTTIRNQQKSYRNTNQVDINDVQAIIEERELRARYPIHQANDLRYK